MTAPQQRAGGLDANARGIAVLVVAVVIGFLLLLKAGDPGGGTRNISATNPTTSTTLDTSGLGGETSTTVAGAGASTTTTAAGGATDRKPGDVSVLVLNADGPAGSAAAASDTIGAAGYKMGTPGNAAAGITLDKTTFYYAEGYQAEATAVASVLGKAADAVLPMPTPVPGPGADKSNVVVVIGKDAGPTSGASTTTTAPA